MNKFVKLSEIKEKELMQKEMRKVNGGEFTQVVQPSPPPPDDKADTGERTNNGGAITQDYG